MEPSTFQTLQSTEVVAPLALSQAISQNCSSFVPVSAAQAFEVQPTDATVVSVPTNEISIVKDVSTDPSSPQLHELHELNDFEQSRAAVTCPCQLWTTSYTICSKLSLHQTTMNNTSPLILLGSVRNKS